MPFLLSVRASVKTIPHTGMGQFFDKKQDQRATRLICNKPERAGMF